jgi:predicted DNA-binding transcriptional regulator YafY
LPKDRQDFVDQLTRKTVILSPSHARGSAANDRQWLFPLQEAAVRRRVTRLRYRGVKHEADTVREVEPLGVVFYGGCWYLVAWCRLRQDLRHFRVDRIKEVTQLPEGFTPRPEFSLTQHLKRVAAQDEMISVKLWFAHHAMDRARRESFVPLREETSDAEGVEVVSATFSLCWLATWLLSFGGSAEALEPEELRESVRKQAQGVLERHAEREAQLV